MLRHELLRQLHRVLRPRTYLEIGVNDGRSLALSRAASIAVDPAFKVTSELRCDLYLAKATSDEFFAREEPLAHFPRPVADLVFIDGMHLAEYSLRDFINVERYTTPGSVIVFDDMLPRSVDEAARERHTSKWTGDVYKVYQALRRFRPDLLCFELDTRPTGTALVLLPDRSSTVLADRYNHLVEEMVVEDPQDVPPDVLTRAHAVDPKRLLTSAVWPQLVALRDRRRPTTSDQVRELLESFAVTAPPSPAAAMVGDRTASAR